MQLHGGAAVVSPATVVSSGTVGGVSAGGSSSSVDIKMQLKHNLNKNHLLLTAWHWSWDRNYQS